MRELLEGDLRFCSYNDYFAVVERAAFWFFVIVLANLFKGTSDMTGMLVSSVGAVYKKNIGLCGSTID